MKGGFFEMNNKILIGILIVGVLAVGGYLFFGNSGAVVSAQGVSVMEVQPDEVNINLNIEIKNESAQIAQEKVGEISDNVLREMLFIGLEKEDVQLVNFNVYPNYEYSSVGRKQDGFIARQEVVIKTEDFDLVSEIVDSAINSGALISYINFELSDKKESEYKAQALEEAGKDAKTKAEATARGLGKSLGSLVSVGNQDFNYGPYRYFAAEGASVADSMEAKVAAADLTPRDLEIRASVSVQYKLRSF